jgi:predicted Fe-Mo cluster-binding NifX family protein
MRVAFAVWNDRVAPVFDVARQVYVIDTRSGQILAEEISSIEGEVPAQKASRLAELGIGTLVCGAISYQLLTTIAAYGIRVVPFIAGDLRQVVRALLSGTLEQKQYAMPGCHQGRRHGGHTKHGRRGILPQSGVDD